MEPLTQLRFNDPAPDLKLQNGTGQWVTLSSLWQAKPLVLAFTRHFGCAQCKEMLLQLRLSQADIEKAGLQLAAVTQGNVEATAQFCAQYAAGIMCFADPTREAYHAYGLGKGNIFQTILSPQVWQGTQKAGEHGFKVELPPAGQESLQMAGTFIIGRDGRIRLPYYYDTIADHPPVELLLKGVLNTDWQKPFDTAMAGS